MPILEIHHIQKSYPDGWTLRGVHFAVEEGERLCLLGPSGCGKTTLLRLIAGLETPDDGRVFVDGKDVTGVPPHLRGIGLMFQEYALFPHKDVLGNVAFGLRMQKLDRETVGARVSEALDLVGLTGFERRDVNQLSGGERQRVALARSLAPRPRLLMLDEPLGALDRTLRERLMEELPAILRRANVTTITVTHDQEEAFTLADRVVLMRDGRVVQEGTPENVYNQPASAWVAQFLGLTNLLDARVLGPGRVETSLGVLEIWDSGSEIWNSATARLLIRPEAAHPDAGGTGSNLLRGIITERSFRGFPAGVTLPSHGTTVTLSLDPQAMALLPADDDQAS
jgi:ABC-type Fe3+/spermidine/putrescine transport system ATPase subunit